MNTTKEPTDDKLLAQLISLLGEERLIKLMVKARKEGFHELSHLLEGRLEAVRKESK